MSAYMDDELSARRVDKEALDWFVRRGDGLNESEEAAFQAWLRADPAHARAYANWRQEWSELDALPADAIDAMRRNLARDLAAESPSRSNEAVPNALPGRASFIPAQPRFASRFLAPQRVLAGACLTLLLAAGITWTYWRQPVFSASYVTARGETVEVALPDGSRLQLDTASRADVVLSRGRREVHLPEGQARFEVSGNPDRPFSVLAGPLRVTVVGTRFAVRFTPGVPEHDGVHIAVEEGRVRVAPERWFGIGSQTLELTAGQAVTSNADGRIDAIAAVTPSEVAPWSRNRISFDNVTLQAALAELERYGDTGLVVRDPSVAALRLTGTFDPRRPENFARLLPQALPVKLATSGGVTEIRSRK